MAAPIVINNTLSNSALSWQRQAVEVGAVAAPWVIEGLAATGAVGFGATPVGWIAAITGTVATTGIMVYDAVQWGIEQVARESVQFQTAVKNGWRQR